MRTDRQSLVFWIIVSAVSLIGMMLMGLALIDARNEVRIIKAELFIQEMEGETKNANPERLSGISRDLQKKRHLTFVKK